MICRLIPSRSPSVSTVWEKVVTRVSSSVFSSKISECSCFQSAQRAEGWSGLDTHPYQTHFPFARAGLRASLRKSPVPSPCVFFAGAPGGAARGRSCAPARRASSLASLSPPSRFCAPGRGSGVNLPGVQLRQRGVATPGALFWKLLPSRPSPSLRRGVYLCLSYWLFPLSLFFSLRVGTPWVQGAQGSPSLLARSSRSPRPGQGAGWVPPALQPGLHGGTEWRFEREVTVAGRALEFSPKAYTSGFSPLRQDPPVVRRPALLGETLDRDFSSRLRYLQRFFLF